MLLLPMLLIAQVNVSVMEVVNVPIISDRPHRSKTYADVASRLSEKDYKYVQYDQNRRSVDEITVIHEGMHMLHASLSKAGWHGFYLGDGYGIRVKIPSKARISQIKVPADKQTSRYRLYLVNSRKWWDKDISYLADEALAYLAGSKVRHDLGWEKRSETIRNGKELTEFFRLGVELVEKVDPEYDTIGLRSLLEHLDNEWKKF